MKIISPDLIERLKVILMKSSSTHFSWEYIYNTIHELETLQGIPEPVPENAKEPTKVPKPKDDKKG